MDQEQEEIQFLGFFGIFKESFKIISACRKILSDITLAVILPLSFVFLAHLEVSEYLFGELLRNEQALDETPTNTTRYSKLSDIISSEWTYFWIFKITYLIFFLILSLLSTSAVVYTIACAYTGKEMTFGKVMSVVPKVWKRLIITFLWNFFIVFAVNIVAILIFTIWILLIGPSIVGLVILSVLLVIYFAVFVYISVVWHLASVVSVLEDSYGLQAMAKSKDLIRGKAGVAIAIFFCLNLCFGAVQMGFEWYVVVGRQKSLAARFAYAGFFFVALSVLILFGLTIQTVVYFVCKSYHHENIDKSVVG